MDVNTLLYRSRRTHENEYSRKELSLRNGYSIAKTMFEDLSFEEFVRKSIDVVHRSYGGSALDSYITTTMSVIKSVNSDIDVFAASVFNAVVLQLNFQTRIFLDGNQNVIFDGNQEYFPIAMLHGNMTLGISIAEEAGIVEPPIWSNASSALELNLERMHVLPTSEVANYQSTNGCRHTGAVLIADPNVMLGDFSIVDRYSYIKDSVNADTTYCLWGTAEMIFDCASQLQSKYPDSEIHLKPYAMRSHNAVEYKAVLLISGLDSLPDVMVRPGVAKLCTFDYRLANNDGDLMSISYAADSIAGRDNCGGRSNCEDIAGLWEQARVRRPFLLSSSAPLPLEARERTSDTFEILHSVLAIKDGILFPSQYDAPFLYASSKGMILNEFGNDPGGTQFYQTAQVDDNGARSAIMRSDKIVRINGAAMPLMFTPQLHKWHSHFMIQCLPRVKIIRDLGEDITIILPHDMRKKQLEMLELLGFGSNKIIKTQPTDLVQAETLYYPWPWRLAFTQYTTEVYDEIARNVAPYYGATPKRVLISRESRKSWRNLINYDSVRQMLVEDYGFEVVAPEKISLSEEVATYANADIVIGAEGAGMYGAVFSKPGTKYITICDEDYVMPILGSLADVRGFDVGYVFGESFRSDRDVNRRLVYGHADFIVDIERLRKGVVAALDTLKPH